MDPVAAAARVRGGEAVKIDEEQARLRAWVKHFKETHQGRIPTPADFPDDIGKYAFNIT